MTRLVDEVRDLCEALEAKDRGWVYFQRPKTETGKRLVAEVVRMLEELLYEQAKAESARKAVEGHEETNARLTEIVLKLEAERDGAWKSE